MQEGRKADRGCRMQTRRNCESSSRHRACRDTACRHTTRRRSACRQAGVAGPADRGAKGRPRLPDATGEDGKVTTTLDMTVSMGHAGSKIPVAVKDVSVETAAGEPLSFKAETNMALRSSKVEGVVKDGKLLAAHPGRRRNKENA